MTRGRDFANPGTAASKHIPELVKNVAPFVEPARTSERAHAPSEVFPHKTNGHRIVSSEWVAASTRPSNGTRYEAGPNGMQWWILSDDAYSAIGLQGHPVFVDPTSRTVVVKLSCSPPVDQAAGDETKAFLAAAAAWVPK